jgi:polysaccharide export outer membrane protein
MRISAAIWALASTVLLHGCSAVDSQPVNKAGDRPRSINPQPSGLKVTQGDDLERLATLWSKRTQDNSAGDYPIGPGDVIEINVPGMEEIKDVFVRVSAEGTIALPFAGTINVTGMTDKGLRDEIRRRLQQNFMRDPQVRLFVREFHSRQVAVIGAVQKPGLFSLTSSRRTIFDMISEAGGVRAEAAERILFIPADPADPETAKKILASVPAQIVRRDPSPLVVKDVEPIVINLNSMVRGGNEKYLAMPARPGDVIMVPGAGEVLVQGWVGKPGAYKITSGLTILGAVAAAGGTVFPADNGSVELIRTNHQGQKTSFSANLDAIKTGEQPDLTLREGDVIDVSSTGPKLVAYGFYKFFTSIMSVGVGAHIPVR